MACFWFGHIPSLAEVEDRLFEPTFACRRCGKTVPWTTLRGDGHAALMRARQAVLAKMDPDQ